MEKQRNIGRPRTHTFESEQPRTIDALIAAQVMYLRRRRGWSQADLGSRLNVSASVVQQLETGARRIQVEQLLFLAYLLDVSPLELLSGSFADDVSSVPLFAGREFPREAVRAWASGEPNAALEGMDTRRYDEQVSDADYLARKRVEGLEEIRYLVHELERAAKKGNEDQIDDCLRVLDAQVRSVRRAFGRVRGTGILRHGAHGTADVTRGTPGALKESTRSPTR